MQVTHIYLEKEWRNEEFRKKAIIEARIEARDINGKIVIKIKDGRHSRKVFEIAYVEQRNGFIINRR